MTSPVEATALSPAPVAEQPTGATRLQILTTEHWSLLASRSLAWTEAFSRTGMFLSTLSFAMVALALAGQASGFGEPFRLFALAVLPIVLFLGLGTHLRLESSNHHDVLCILGMNRIRHEYVRLAPDLEPLFVMGTTDDLEGVIRTMAVLPGRPVFLNLIAATPAQVAILNAALVGAIAGFLAVELGAGAAVGVAAAGSGFVVAVAAYGVFSRRTLQRVIREHQPLVPTPNGGPSEGQR